MNITPPRKKNFITLITEKKFSFIFIFLFTYLLTFSLLSYFQYIPVEIQENTPVETKEVVRGEDPVRITIPKIGVNSVVLNPKSTDIKILDAALLKGAVHYPGSGLAGKGNLFIFGHSTSYAIVNNQAFKTFDNLKDLKVGDQIEVDSQNKRYFYNVRTVTLTTAEAALVDFSTTERMLTISTCNTFGEKQERYVVQADFVKNEAI